MGISVIIISLLLKIHKSTDLNLNIFMEGEIMKRFKSLDGFQKGVLLFMAIMILSFAVVYYIPTATSKEGFAYEGTILVPSQENGSTVYSGEIHGQKACFTVSEDKTVVFQYGDKTYGPYTSKEDPTAIPTDEEIAESTEHMTGVELRKGEEILFRGGVLDQEDSYLLYNEDGSLYNDTVITFTSSDGIERDQNGDEIDSTEPSAYTILKLMNDPELTSEHQDQYKWFMWFMAVLLCVVNTFSILFADELYRFKMSLRIRDVDYAEPSDYEMIRRFFLWIGLTIAALAIFIIGLR